MSKPIIQASVAMLASCAAIVVSAAGVTDGLVFDLGLSGTFVPSNSATFGSVFDAAHWSAATRPIATHANAYSATGEEGEIVPQPVAITEETVTAAAYMTQPWTQKCLTFPFNMTAGDGSVSNIFPSLVAMPIIDTGDRQPFTVFIRFRWDGNYRGSRPIVIVDNARRDKDMGYFGWGLQIYASAAAQTEDIASISTIRVLVRGANHDHSLGTSVPRGGWVDLAVSFSDNGDGASTTVNVRSHVVKSDLTDSIYSATQGTINKTVAYFRDAHGKTRNPLVLGGQPEFVYSSGTAGWLPSTGYSPWGNALPGTTFCGSIAALRVYNRVLSADEVKSLFWDASGIEVSAGSRNGSSAEFGTAADADLAEEFDPTAQPAWKMRGELTAENPTLKLKFPLNEEEAGLPRYLTVFPVHSGTGAQVPVKLSVNDSVVGTLDLAGNGPVDFPIRKNRVTRDAGGKIKLELTRVGDLTGTLGIDALQFGGSWAFGKADGKYNDWCFLSVAPTSTSTEVPRSLPSPVGAPHGRKFLWDRTRSVNRNGTGYDHPAETILFSLPTSAASQPTTYEVKLQNPSISSLCVLDFYLNGELFRSETGLSAANWIKLDIPSNTLSDGLNTLTISNASPSSAVGSGNTYNNLFFDCHRFTVQNPPSLQGMTVIIR